MSLRTLCFSSPRLARLRLLLSLIVCLAAFATALPAQTAHWNGTAAVKFGSVNVGASSASPNALVFTFDTGGTLGSTAVLTQGAANRDFTDAGSGTCTANTSYSAGNTCTVNVTFKPQHPGTRYGAATLLDTSGNLLATGYVQGAGVGPQVAFGNFDKYFGFYGPGSQRSVGNGFNYPMGVAVDASGNLFIADYNNNAVKEILAAGGYLTVKTLAKFYQPMAVAVDGAGNVYVTDTQDSVVKEIVAAGGYKTINSLGSGFSYPDGVAVDGSGNVFVADSNNLVVKEIVAAGGYTTVNTLGNGVGFTYPYGVAVDGRGNVFVTDAGQDAEVKEIVAAGGYTTVKVLAKGLGIPHGVAVDGMGNVFVIDQAASELMEILAASGYSVIKVLSSSFSFDPTNVAVGGRGNIFVGDSGNNTVQELDFADPPTLSFNSTVEGQTGTDSPRVVTVFNIGTSDMSFPAPASGDNPSLMGSGFTLDPSTTCPELTASSAAFTLAAGAGCIYSVDFTPTVSGVNTGSLAITDNSLNASAGVTQTISLTGEGLGPAKLAFFMPPPVTLGTSTSPGAVSVGVETASGLVVTKSTATVTLTVTGPNSYSKVYTARASSGVATFSGLATLKTAGSYSYTATDTPDGLIQAVATESVWAPHLAFTTPPPVSLALGQAPGTVAVSVEDPSNHVVTTSSATVTLTVTGPNSYSKAYTAVASSGVASFTSLAALNTPGGYSYTATDTPDGLTQAVATESVWAPHLAFTTPPPGTLGAGSSPATVAVGVEDPSNNVLTTSSATITLTLTGPNSYSKLYTAAAVNGVAAFNTLAALSAFGSYTYTATDTPDGLTQTVATQIVVQGPYTAPTTNVGAVTAAQKATLVFTASGTLNAIAVLTQGAANLDFQLASGSTCQVGTAYTAGQTCTVNYAFGPRHPGPRLGGIVLTGLGANVLAMAYISGTGVGPQVTFATIVSGNYIPSAQMTLGSGFSDPYAVAVDAIGDVFVSDLVGHEVKEILAAGNYATTITIGSGLNGLGLAVDGNGNVFVASGGEAVNEIVAAGGYTTVKALGSGIKSAYGVAVDGSGNVFVADYHDTAVKEIVAADGYTTVKTLGSGFSYPRGVAVDGSGNVFVADTVNNAVKEIVATGGYTTIKTLGSGFINPADVAVDGSGNVFVADVSHSAVKEIVAASGYTTVTTLGGGFEYPERVAVGGAGNVFVADDGTDHIEKLDYADPPSLSFAATVLGQISGPQTVAVSNDGNAALRFPVPVSGDNPSLDDGFTLDVATTCPQLTASSSASGTLAAGVSCTYAVDFIPAEGGTFSGSLALTDNNLHASPSTTQAISLTGQGLGPTKLAFATLPPEFLGVGSSPGTVTVSLEIASGVVVTGFSATVTLTVTGPNSYSKTYTATSVDGVATFSTLAALIDFGSYTYTATDTPDGLTEAVATEAVVQAPYTPPTTNVGASSTPQTATLLFTASGTLNAVAVLTQGAANRDFQKASGGNCATGTAYTVGQTCTVNYTFDPKHPGSRLGGIVLTDSSANVLAMAYISGTGVGPQVTFADTTWGAYLPAVQSTLGSGFYNFYGVAVDGSGNVFVADTSNNAVKEIVAAGGYTTIKTLGSGIKEPTGVAVDGSGNVFVADFYNDAVKEIVAASGYTTVKTLGSGFNHPFGVAVDGSGNVFVADYRNNAVKEIVAVGDYTIVKTLGSGFNSPRGVAVDGAGNVFVADTYNNAVKEIVAAGGYITINTLGVGFKYPSGVALDGIGNLFVANYKGNAVNEILAAGGYVTVNTLGSGFSDPAGVAVDGSGNVFVADFSNNAMKKLDYADPPSLNLAATPLEQTSSDSPRTVTISNDGNGSLAFSALSYPTDFPEANGVGSDCTASSVVAQGTGCTLSIDFAPQQWSSTLLSESIALTTDSLNATTAQSVGVSGKVKAVPASLTAPAPGAVLAGSSQTFTWTAPPGATGYNFRLGTVPGSNDLYASGAITATSATPTRLPTNRETIYATLFTNYGSTQISSSYTFTAATAKATLTSPASGSVLAGPSVKFTWTAAPGSTGYNLRLGTTPGANNLYSSGKITATSATPKGLPTNGETIYAELITDYVINNNLVQVSNSYTFTAATQAELTSPANGSVLTGAKVTFTWNAGTSATSYNLRIGTSVGANNLYGSGPITLLSAAPTNLPTNSETLYVQLCTNFGSSQVCTNYVYTAAP